MSLPPVHAMMPPCTHARTYVPVGRAVRAMVGALVGAGVGEAVMGPSFFQKVADLSLSLRLLSTCFRLCWCVRAWACTSGDDRRG